MSIEWQQFGPRRLAPQTPPEERLRTQLCEFDALIAALRRSAAAGRPMLLLLNDSQRATQARPVLCLLAELLAAQGLHVLFSPLIATGTHRFDAAARAAFEAETLAGCGLHLNPCGWHDADDPAGLVEIGRYRFHHWAAGHSDWLAIGSVEPHYFAGLTGAHKTATIGILSRRDIEHNHAGALDPGSDCFALAGNPVHEGILDMLSALRGAGKCLLAVSQLLEGGVWVDSAVGSPLETTFALAPAAEVMYRHQVAEPADLLHLIVTGPLGRSLYQADKALKNNHRAVRDGGAIILDAECGEGVGSLAFLDLLRTAPTHAAALAHVRQAGYRLGDHKAVKLRELLDRGVRLAIVSRQLPADVAAILPALLCESVAAALDILHARVSGPLAHGYRILDAGNVVVRA